MNITDDMVAALRRAYGPNVRHPRSEHVEAIRALWPLINEEIAQAYFGDDGPQGMLWVGVCPACFQPVPYGMRCNSGAHEGPDSDPSEAPLAVRSIDLRHAFVNEAVRVMRIGYGAGEQGDAWCNYFTDELHRHFNPTTKED